MPSCVTEPSDVICASTMFEVPTPPPQESPEQRTSCDSATVSPSYRVTKSQLASSWNAENETSGTQVLDSQSEGLHMSSQLHSWPLSWPAFFWKVPPPIMVVPPLHAVGIHSGLKPHTAGRDCPQSLSFQAPSPLRCVQSSPAWSLPPQLAPPAPQSLGSPPFQF